MNFIGKLAQISRKNRSLLCIGLDTNPALLPEKTGILEFNKAVIDATKDLVCAYKPNIAFYEAEGMEGLRALEKTREYIPEDIPVIIDAKRGDIGNTAKAYARSLFERYNFDAMTANPYLGYDSLEPFFQYREKGVFILCRTSNPGAGDFQSLLIEIGGKPRKLFEIVAERVNMWNIYGNLGLVVGATYPQELKTIRAKYPEIPLLIPGVGTQGGDLSETVQNGADAKGERTIINSSRQILYASKGKDFAEAARKAAQDMRDKINEYFNKK
jgi:orotidine-5'-phosphate decarboxylase